MTVSSIASAPSAATSANAAPDTSTSIAGNFDTFLTLLTTQLQNQDPLSPLDTNQFTQQLVEFSGVEQQLKSNDLLTTLVTNSTANAASTAASYLGATITADGSQAQLSDGKATWNWNADKAATATVNVLDSTGATIFTQTGPISAGVGSFTWNGQSDDGSLYTSGEYSLKVTASDASGQPVAISTQITGTVDSVDLSNGTPVLNIGSIQIPLDAVKTLRKSS